MITSSTWCSTVGIAGGMGTYNLGSNIPGWDVVGYSQEDDKKQTCI